MTPNLKIITMRDVVPEPVEWLWEPYIALGKITVIQGDGGEGKTTLATAIAAAVSRGDALPGGYGVISGDVIFQNAEDGIADTIVSRLERFGADIDRIHFIDEDEMELSLADERIEQTIVEKGAKLCVLDPIQAYLGGANMNSAGGVRPLMKRLGAVAARTGCAMLLIGHMNKNGNGRSQYRGLGSVDINAAARSVLTVGRIDTEENMRAIVQNKNSLGPKGASLAFSLDPVHGFTWQGECDITIDELLSGKKKPESQFAKARRLIETALARGPVPAADMFQMAEEEGISPKTLNRAKDALGVHSYKSGNSWYWDLPIVVETEYTDAGQDGHHGQESQEGHSGGHENNVTTMTALTMLPAEAEVV